MYRLLAMCTTMAARITTTIVARTSAHPSRRVGLRILHRAIATLIAVDSSLINIKEQPRKNPGLFVI